MDRPQDRFNLICLKNCNLLSLSLNTQPGMEEWIDPKTGIAVWRPYYNREQVGLRLQCHKWLGLGPVGGRTIIANRWAAASLGQAFAVQPVVSKG